MFVDTLRLALRELVGRAMATAALVGRGAVALALALDVSAEGELALSMVVDMVMGKDGGWVREAGGADF